MRTDLVIRSHDDQSWMVKDPISMVFTLLEKAELKVLQLLDGRRSADQLLQEINADSFLDERVSIEDLKDVIQQFANHRLIVQTVPHDSLRLRPVRKSWAQQLLGVFRIRIPVLNPSRWIDPCLPFLNRWLNAPFFCVATIWIAFAVGVFLLRFDQFTAEVPQLFQLQGPESLVVLMAVFLVVKFLHEAGHAVAARMCQSECNECGVMLLFFTPVLYTDVSDGWTCSRNQRILMTLAGIGVELLIAATCLLLWAISLPGFVRILLLNAVLICSVNTLLFNGNPLLKFDGYFVLADYWNLPNLSSRSGSIVRSTCVGWLTGKPIQTPDSGVAALHIYGWASAVYRVFLCLGLASVIQLIAATWNQQWIGRLLVFLLLTGSLFMPAIQFFLHLKATIAEQVSESANSIRSWARPLATLSVSALLFMIPLPKSVTVPAYTQPTSLPVYTPFEGTVQPFVNYGSELNPGDVICLLQNSDLESEIVRWKSRRQDIQTRIDVLQNNPLTANADSLPTLQESLNAVNTKLDALHQEERQLTVRAPGSGVLLPPRTTARQTNEVLPELWHGLPLQASNQGARLNRGTLIGHVGQLADAQFVACVDEQTLEFLQAGQPARFYAPGSSTIAEGNIQQVGRLPLDEVPAAMLTTGIAFGTATETGFRPAETTYAVLMTPTENDPADLYAVGTVRIQVARQSLFARFVRFLRLNFR